MAKVLVIGSGAREHAIAKSFLDSDQVETVFVAPGNPGMKRDGIETVAIGELDFDALINFAKENQVDLTFVGPEVPLAAGIVDEFESAGLKAFGPNKQSAQLESDKDFAKHFMMMNGIPTAQFGSFTNESDAIKFAAKFSFPVVVKQTGLAAGKGVAIAQDQSELETAVTAAIASDGRVLIEEFIKGEEFSVMVLLGGKNHILFPVSQDHKKIFANDEGPNTGGMGAYSPVPHVDDKLVLKTIKTIIDPTIAGLEKQQLLFNGVMYIGCIMDGDTPKVIEYNLRFGDPETQVLLPQLKTDFYHVITELMNGHRPDVDFQMDSFYLGVVVSAPGYPENPKQDIPMPDLPANVYYAGVHEQDGQLLSKGGRIFTIYDHAATLKEAQQKVYAELSQINLSDFYFRPDIGYRDL
ncbi:phosphoribosylamine--glycine ligase [Lentilactobacillus sp. Marseille-Q4993]|uniref:phosphoribosylamine--glycine ligase n=1 Tax=Lentilactobacillus sp. Marseille-Q4993 TaxID=3039492 RepID=UPI0024BCDA88|nr:phosphoribosylamine--glycine ligase [Lentilactobacillus sp. Marseille-Q4993]